MPNNEDFPAVLGPAIDIRICSVREDSSSNTEGVTESALDPSPVSFLARAGDRL